MYVLLSNSISSRRGPSGEPDENTVFPNFFAIDYIRVWQPPVTVVAKVAIEPVAVAVVAKLEATDVPAIAEPAPEELQPEAVQP